MGQEIEGRFQTAWCKCKISGINKIWLPIAKLIPGFKRERTENDGGTTRRLRACCRQTNF
jgi:hypothetical protein